MSKYEHFVRLVRKTTLYYIDSEKQECPISSFSLR